jgi:hypothetical protein
MSNFQPKAVYNADKKSLIGLFASGSLTAQFVFGKYKTGSNTITWRAIAAKSTQLGCRLAIRELSSTQLEELGGSFYVLKDETYRPFVASMSSTIKRLENN